jgi:probable DNA metabolism protein
MAESLNLNKFIEYSDKEEEFQALWKTFFDSIAINERKNIKLQQNNMPGRFRSNMTEFKK